MQWNGDLPHPLSLELARQYEKRYKEKAVHGIGAIFQAMLVVRRAIETAASMDRDAVNDALHKIEVLPGPDLLLPYEKIKFDETGINTFGRPMVTQFQDGNFVTIWPEQYASKKARIPEDWKKR